MNGNGIKWFEKKWLVNMKTKSRLMLGFLIIAALAVIVGAFGVYIAFTSGSANALIYAIIIGVVCVIAIVLALMFGSIDSFLITDPMMKNELYVGGLARGDFEYCRTIVRPRDRITKDYKDEIGQFSRVVSQLILYMRNLEGCVKKISEGDLSVEVPIACPNDQIGNAVAGLVDNFHTLVESIVVAIDRVTTGSTLVSDSSSTLARGATQQASAVQELTASLEQISSQIQLNAKNAKQANELSQKAKTNASEGNEQMKEMLKAMDEINVSSSNINKIIKVIDDIAFQTNILALNAAVEAARAGQHGKGFAVVAEEVRNLAAKSASAAKETTEMIENSIKKIDAGTKIANDTASALNEIVTEVDKAADLIDSIALASVEQAQGIEQINLGISQVSQVVQTNAATAEESAAASEDLTNQALKLKQSAAIFKLKSTKAIAAPKAAPKPQSAPPAAPAEPAAPAPAEPAPAPVAKSASKPRISLGEQDFGKY